MVRFSTRGGAPTVEAHDMVSHADMILRILAGAALGGVIGYERDVHRRPVGLRTHLIVAMTAATFMVISTQFVYWQHFSKDEPIEVDASRIAASVVSGIGFLAGGAILRTGITVQGLTTAAGLWLVTAIGMAAGAGMYLESAVVTAFGIVALTVLRRFEDKTVQRRRVTVVLRPDAGGIGPIVDALHALGASPFDVEYERDLNVSDPKIVMTLDVQLDEKVPVARLVEVIESSPGVLRVHVQHRS